MKRIIAFILSVAMLFTLLPGLTMSTRAAERVDIYYNGNAQDSVILPKGDDIELNAVKNVAGEAIYQWQIDIADNMWVDISGETGINIRVSYAMIANILSDNEAKIRCKMLCEGETINSAPIIITVSEENSNTAVVIPEEDTVQILQPTPIPLTNTIESDEKVVDSEVSSGDVISSGDVPVDVDDIPVATMFSLRTASVNAVADEPADEPAETVSVVINYVFTNGELAAQPYTASIAKGSDFSAVVNNPEVIGYLPYEEQNLESTSSVTLNYTDIQGDKTITVTYKPTKVNYTIVYKLQNVDGNGYTEDINSRKKVKGLTDSIVSADEIEKNFEGFSMLWYDTPTIAADGSTVVEVYYDRNFYLMLFELDGGYGVEPVYARYGSAVSVGTPTKAGYSFGGWSETDGGTTTVPLPTTIPAVNKQYYYAIWTPDATAKVTVVFWGENANDEKYSYLEDYTKVINLKPGREFTYSEKEMLVCDKEEHTHSNDCIGCGKEEHTHSGLGDSCYTLTCTTPSHIHGTSCYEGVGDKASPSWAPDNPKEGQVYSGSFILSYSYIYIKGNWYNYSGSVSNGSTANPICDQTETSHTHGESCYKLTCTQEAHTHDKSCYTCKKEAHTHVSNCYMQGVGLDTTRWKFVKSDTVTVAADGSTIVNVYYDRTEFMLTFKKDKSTVKTITDKWGADIHNQFPIKNGEYTMWWSVPNDCSSMKPGTQFGSLDTMPAENITFTYEEKTKSATLHYYVEVLPGKDGKTASQIYSGFTSNNYAGIDGTKKFESYKDINISQSGRLTYTEEFHDIVGFRQYISNPKFDKHEQGGTTNGVNTNNYLLYARNSFDIAFYNPTNLIKTQENVSYQMALSGYDWTPTADQAPDKYEPGSIKFDGWYLNPDCTGEKFVFSTNTMPAGPNNENGEVALALYAKWTPVNHDVKIYLTASDVKNGTNPIRETLVVLHGNKVEEADIPADPINGDLKFVGWFYTDGDVEKAFDFNNMPVNKDLTIYAKWSDTTIVPYYVYYRAKDSAGNVILNKNGLPIELADPTTGQALTGISRTFEAKASEELLEDYQEGYFPETKSHTMVLEAGKDNTYIFYYVPADEVPYKVYYKIVDENGNVTGYAIKNADGTEYVKEVNDNRKAVVTENFVVVPGYMPDAYQKRLVISADGVGNEITFYYVEDEDHAYYQLTHYTENIDGGWTEYSSSQAKGDVGTTYNAQPLTINGFTYDEKKTEIVVGDNTTLGTSHSLTTEGLEIRHYYTRESYPYEVHYLEQVTKKELATVKTTDANKNPLTGKYGEVVSEQAIVILGYECITPSPSTLTIRIETDDVKNIIYFYYKEAEVDINYKVVGPDGVTDFGTVDLNDGTTTGAMAETSETVLAKLGVAFGATATASSKAYKFVGWYADEACTQQISTNASYIPTKPSDGIWKEATYYAKFEYNLTSMTISKTVTGTSYDVSDIFIFDVKGSDGSEFSIYLKAGETKTITDVTVGVTYTVTERTNWSTRYTNTSSPEAKTLVADTTQNVFAFTNEIKESKWLSVTKMKTNVFDKKN